LSRALASRIDVLWEAQKQAKYLEAVAKSTNTGPVTPRYLQRKYTPFSPRPVKDAKVYSV